MHGQHVALGNQEIHYAKDRFLHLAGVLCAADEDDFAGEIGKDEGPGAGSVALWNSLELGGGDDADGQTVGRVGAAIEILDKEVAVAQVLGDPLQQRIEALRREGLVDAAPVDQGVSNIIVHDEFVFGAAPGARSGGCHQGSIGCQTGFTAQQCSLNELRNRQISVHMRSSRQCPENFFC